MSELALPIGVTSGSGRDNEIEHRTPSGGMVRTCREASSWRLRTGLSRQAGRGGAGVTHRGVLVPDRHAAVEDEPVRRETGTPRSSRTRDHAICGQLCSPSARRQLAMGVENFAAN